MSLDDTLAKHRISYHITLPPKDVCRFDCPACAQRELVEWLSERARYMDGPFHAHFPEDANMVVFDKDKVDWQDLRQKLGLT